MRLTCPNCDAQYEVPDEVIPETGRDVQCSNCGDTWFQHHPDHPPAPKEEPPSTVPHGWEAALDAVDVAAPADAGETDTDGHSRARRELDPDVTSVLREEADREQQARAAEAQGGLETQPDLGLDAETDETGRRTREARERMARLRGTAAPAADEADDTRENDIDPVSRRGLLPDIDEINSSLRNGDGHDGASAGAVADAEAQPDRSSFRFGFMLVLLIALLMLLAYLLAGNIAEALPPARPLLVEYVSQVNAARLWLDTQVGALNQWFDALTGGGTNGG